MIGGDSSKALEPKEVILSKNGGPYAFRTLLRSCIVGPVGTSKNDVSLVCNITSVQDLSTKNVAPHYFAVDTEVKDLGIEKMLHKMYSVDFTDQRSSTTKENDCEMSIEDRQFMEIMERECTREGKHYKFPLPLRDPEMKFPDNKKMAGLRLHNLKKRFKRDRKLHEDYTNFMRDMIGKGHTEVQDKRKCHSGKIWYIPHHAVYHPSKPGKIRVVLIVALSGMVYR